ncbi:hypothetical protein ACLOJK_026451 [Asimina triloba]
MALRKCQASSDAPSPGMAPSNLPRKVHEKAQLAELESAIDRPLEADVDIDLREVYFLIMHFLSAGPCQRTFGQFWNELLEHQLLPRRYHAWYSRSGLLSGDENDNGLSFPLNYNNLVGRYKTLFFLLLYPHIENNHLVKLLKQLILNCTSPSHGMVGGSTPSAADVPTLLGFGSFSLLESERNREGKKPTQVPAYLRWPHMRADQVRGLSLREIGGGFPRHHRAPSIRAACYAIAKPSTMVQKMQIIKKLRGHQNAVYCAVFDHTGRYVITGSDDRLVKIWSMETAFCLSSCRGHEGDITDLAVSSNDALVASSSNDFIIRVWRLPDGLPISVLRGHTAAVTAIAFSPRPSAVYQLLSPPTAKTELIAGRSSDPSPNTGQQGHQILCCAYNANGTVFVTGSSDTFARVWNAVRCNPEDSDHPFHEMDLLSGHENDVNYVQFRFTHDNIVTCSRDGSAIIWIPRSRRSHGKVGRWTRAYHLKVPPPPVPPQPPRGGPRQRFQHTPRGVNMIVWSLDNRFVLAAIMDCRICVWNAVDGSLVHSLTGHTESVSVEFFVPNLALMTYISFDLLYLVPYSIGLFSVFVARATFAGGFSLFLSKTYVLDVHPFNPRIAMSAGYDGRTIVWDIWEGTPIRIYETGHFKLVDGKFSPKDALDGTSIVLSDEVGQIYILASGQGESQKDAKYDQFFLGDYRPLIRDTHGNVLDQETQLAPHRRNIQDLLCDSSMIPYPEPYQNMFQQRRLGALGIEWRPPTVNLAVGPSENGPQDYQLLPFVDLDRWIEPVPEFLDVMDWEQENEVQSDDNDSEYNVTEEDSSEGEQEFLSGSSSGDPECSAEDSEVDHSNTEVLRRSKRKKLKAEVEFTTSGRRVKRRNLDERDGMVSKSKKRWKSRKGRSASRRKSSTSKSLRPQRLAARNALNLFSRINGTSTDGEEEEAGSETDSESESLQPDSNTQSDESNMSTEKEQQKQSKENSVSLDACDTVAELPESKDKGANKRRLVLKFSVPDSRKHEPENTKSEAHVQGNEHRSIVTDLNQACSSSQEPVTIGDVLSGCKNSKIRWGEVKVRTSKRPRLGEASDVNLDVHDANGHVKSEDEHGMSPRHSGNCTDVNKQDREFEGKEQLYRSRTSHHSESLDNVDDRELPTEHAWESLQIEENGNQQKRGASFVTCNGYRSEATSHAHNGYADFPGTSECRDYNEALGRADRVIDNKKKSVLGSKTGIDHKEAAEESTRPIARRLRIRSKGLASPPLKLDLVSKSSEMSEEDDTSFEESDSESEDSDSLVKPILHDSKRLNSCSNIKMYDSVYKRSKRYRFRVDSEDDICDMEAGTSSSNRHDADAKMGFPEIAPDSIRRTRSMDTKAAVPDQHPVVRNFKTRETHGSAETSKRAEKASNGCDQLLCEEWKSSSRVNVGLRSARNRRESYYDSELNPMDKRTHHSTRKPSWLMLIEHEECYRYIPQLGDDIAYIRQGHQEYLEWRQSREIGPWRSSKGDLRAVEFCRVQGLEYSTLPGSGESCCKLTVEFTDPSSNIFGKTFKLTLPELIDFSDFIVERARYDACIKRNWTHRDKCQVWWRNEDGEGWTVWSGRILAVKPKLPEFPDSPWERYVIQYPSDSSQQHRHSPWELHDPDTRWEHPHIAEHTRQRLLSLFNKIEQNRSQDFYGIEKLKQVAHKSDFLNRFVIESEDGENRQTNLNEVLSLNCNRFPVPLSVEVIKRRLENNYYRSLEAIKHDMMVMLSNVQSYFGRNPELGSKMRRLSDWVNRTLSSL